MPHLRAGSSPLRVCKRPTAAQGFVELNDREAARDFEAREGVLSGEELLLSFEDFVVAGPAFFVAHGRQFDSLAAGFDGLGLFDSPFFVSAARDERVGHLAEGDESGVLILELRFLARRFGLAIAAGIYALLIVLMFYSWARSQFRTRLRSEFISALSAIILRWAFAFLLALGMK